MYIHLIYVLTRRVSVGNTSFRVKNNNLRKIFPIVFLGVLFNIDARRSTLSELKYSI